MAAAPSTCYSIATRIVAIMAILTHMNGEGKIASMGKILLMAKSFFFIIMINNPSTKADCIAIKSSSLRDTSHLQSIAKRLCLVYVCKINACEL